MHTVNSRGRDIRRLGEWQGRAVERSLQKGSKNLLQQTALSGDMHEEEDHEWEHRGRAAAGRVGNAGKDAHAEEEEEEEQDDADMDAAE